MSAFPAAPRWTWPAAQILALGGTVLLLIGLLVSPAPVLDVLWNLVIPLLPLSFLINPLLWRNVCPLATASLPRHRVGGGRLEPGRARRQGLVGVLLLLLLVPARRFGLNHNGLSLAGVIVGVLLLAMVLNRGMDMKAGFCNAICPVLPVEKLYGQRPLMRVANARCVPCSGCTIRGCLDLVPTGAIKAAVGREPGGAGWLASPYGLFLAAFPGFILGYFTLTDQPLDQALAVYTHIGIWMAASGLLVVLLVLLTRPRPEFAWRALAVAAAGIYYWFAARGVSRVLHGGDAGIWMVRILAGAVILWWLVGARSAGQGRALRHDVPRSRARPV